MNNPQRPTDAGCVERADCCFVDCPPGLFEFAGMLCFKSEYSSKPGQPDAYCVDTGEYFWGGTRDLEARCDLIVRPVLAALSASGGDAAELRKWPDIGQDPMKGSRPVDRYETSAAACRAAYVQQQTHVPDQTALVWRWHLGTLLEQHIRLKSILANKRDAAELAAADMRERAAQTAGSFHMRQGSNDLADARTKDWIAAAIRALPLAKQEQS